MKPARKILLTILFAVFLFKIVVWILLSFELFSGLVNGFFRDFFANVNRAFILIIPALLLIDLFFSSVKKLYVVLSVVYFLVYGLSITTDNMLRQNFPEITGDILETLAFVLFLVPVLVEFIKKLKTESEKRTLTFHYAELGWAVFLVLFGIADLISGNRLALRAFADYTLVFCSITFITQFLSDKEKI